MPRSVGEAEETRHQGRIARKGKESSERLRRQRWLAHYRRLAVRYEQRPTSTRLISAQAVPSSASTTCSDGFASDLEETDWDRTIDVNLNVVWLSMKHELRAMLEVGVGSIVNTSSIARLIGVRNSAAYTASKHGVVGLTKTAAPEVAGRGLARQRGLPRPHSDADARPRLRPQPKLRTAYAAADPTGRIAAPREVADVVVFLCSDAAPYLTGASIPVNGGWTAG